MRDKTKYNAYINSPDWQEKKERVFEAKWYKCEACWISEWLQVHHGTYRRLYKEKRLKICLFYVDTVIWAYTINTELDLLPSNKSIYKVRRTILEKINQKS